MMKQNKKESSESEGRLLSGGHANMCMQWSLHQQKTQLACEAATNLAVC